MENIRYHTLISVPQELRSDRIVVRPYHVGDSQSVFAAIDESREHLQPWLAWVKGHTTPDATYDLCARSAAKWLLRTDFTAGIFSAGDGCFLGGTGLHQPDWMVRSFEIGYWVRTSAEKQGYAGEAVRLLTRLAFDGFNARRVEIRCDPRNERSRLVAERSGFLLEGRLRNVSLGATGELRDTLVFSLTPADFARLKTQSYASSNSSIPHDLERRGLTTNARSIHHDSRPRRSYVSARAIGDA